MQRLSCSLLRGVAVLVVLYIPHGITVTVTIRPHSTCCMYGIQMVSSHSEVYNTGGKVGTWNSTADLSGFVALALLDLPLSLAADIALLPIAFPWMFLFG